LSYELKYIIPLTAAVFLSAGGHSFGQSIKAGTKYCIDKFGQSEYSLILKDISGETKTKLAGDAELRKKQVETLREMFAFGCEAEKRGIAREETNAAELENIRSEIIATSYDQQLNKGKAAPMFSGITDAQVAAFYKAPANITAFERFIRSKVALLHRADPNSAEREIADDEKEQAKNFYAKIKISENESVRNAATLGADFKRLTDLKVFLQQSQFLARTLSEQMGTEAAVSSDEVSKYIAGHPEFDTSAKKAEAAKILARAEAGEAFAALADQYSQDPGNIGENGKKNGGSYVDVPKGRMIKPFENAALSLQPGGIYPDLVESDFGYHIIKLERKTGTGDDLKYDVRHILISTTVKDPTNPNGRELPIKEYVRTKLESEKESALVAKIVADNPIAMEELQIGQPVAEKPVVAKPAAKKPVARKTAVRRRH
jgi:parvulin-like peptidyl-prolyl isomerase